jgi:Na+/H+ antiporter NhaD/arsenite permease-like protein
MLLILIFILGYLAIALEHPLRLNKAASALLTGTFCWTAWVLSGEVPPHDVVHQLEHHLAGIAQILFFLLGAMVVVELIDAYDGFQIVTDRIRTTNRRRLLWLVSGIAFVLSAVLDNLTTTIVMLSLVRQLIADREDRWMFAGMIVIAANAGGAFSPMGDVTTTMLWIGGQVTATNIIAQLLLPSLACLLVPLVALTWRMKGDVTPPSSDTANTCHTPPRERNLVFGIGLGALLFVPVFKSVTHLPPFMAMLLGLGVIWVLTEVLLSRRSVLGSHQSVAGALERIDTPSILFFLGILLAVSALESAGFLAHMATWLDQTIGHTSLIVMALGVLSAIVDNVPLVAATQGMYALADYPPDHFIWEFIAYCTGTGGSMLIIGSAAGVAAMGMEQIDFMWYLRRIAPWAALGFVSGALVFLAQTSLLGGH